MQHEAYPRSKVDNVENTCKTEIQKTQLVKQQNA